jgi:chromosome partitioning protein
MRKIAILNQKGGVAKTTCTINIGAGLAMQGKNVCLIDMDPQSHLTKGLGVWQADLNTVYDLMRARIPLDEVLTPRDGLYIIPAGLDMAGADLEMGGEIGRERKLEKALKRLQDYDYVLIDCPPALNLLTINALTYAQEVFIPIEPEYFALEGTTQLEKTIELVKDGLNPQLSISGVIITKYNQSRNLTKEVESQIRNHFREAVFKTVIRIAVAIAEAPASGQTIFEYDPRGHGAIDYEKLCKEIIRREER